MPNSVDLTGDKYARLKVIGFSHRAKKAYWLCMCDCGTETVVRSDLLRSGQTQSCGCLKAERVSKAVIERCTTHGLRHHPMYNVWFNKMKERCSNPKTKSFKDYGGRGIKVCGRWAASFTAFLEDMGERPTRKHEIDRIDNDGDYEPSNRRWVTRVENARNKSTTKLTERDVEYIRACSVPSIELAKRYGVSKHCIYDVRSGRSWK